MHKGNWYTLDNSAKLMPSITNNLNTNVFRLACTLKEDVDRETLQFALDEALKEFPMFLYTMKNGIFWHYLEESTIKPQVEEECCDPCARIDSGLLFRLSYYKKRINLEVYHVLADGNGAMEFLKFVVASYLNKKYNIESDEPINESSEFEKARDDFKKFDKSNFHIRIPKAKRAYKLNMPTKENIAHDVIEVHLSVQDVKNEAKKYNTTLTIYLTAILVQSIIANARIKDLKKTIGITLPIDLRNTFPSKTSRNFFYTMTVQYKPNSTNELEDIIRVLETQFKEHLTKESLQDVLNTYMIIEKFILIRLIPNFIKDFCLSYISDFAKTAETMVLSNLKFVTLPDIYEPYIDSFTALASTNKMQLTVISYKDNLVLGFTSHFINKEIERTMIKKLVNISSKDIKIVSNVRGEKDE